MAGENIDLMTSALRSSKIEILGSGLGSYRKDIWEKLNTEVIPEMLQLAAEEKLIIETETANLNDIETAWEKDSSPGKRLVIIIK